MAEAHHKFDISLIPRVLSEPSSRNIDTGTGSGPRSGRGAFGSGSEPATRSSSGSKSGRGIDLADEEVLRVFRGYRDSQLHVVDIAREAGLEFDDALKGVLRLMARGDLNLHQRDTIANDHLVSLTPKGQASL